MSDIDKTIITLQHVINNARNNHLKTTTIFISTLSDCMMYLKKLRRIEQPGVLLFDDPGPIIVRCKDCRYGQYCTDGETTYQCFKWNSNEFGALHEQDWFCADGERK